MSNTAPSRADPVVVFPLGWWCPPQETSQPHPPQFTYRFYWILSLIQVHIWFGISYKFIYTIIFAVVLLWSALNMCRSCHLISNTNYTTRWGLTFPEAKMRYHKNLSGELAKCNETPSRVQTRKLIVDLYEDISCPAHDFYKDTGLDMSHCQMACSR